MSKPITLKDLAKELNLSVTTVSKALKNYPDISKKTKEKVRKLAESKNYTPNILAQNLRTKSTHLIGLVIPQIAHDFFSHIISGVTEYANEKGYLVIVLESQESSTLEQEHLAQLQKFKVDGILLSLANDTKDLNHLAKLKEAEIPVVMFDKVDLDFPCSKVKIDDYDSAFRATQHLINQGYKKIAHLGGDILPRTAKNRLKGYRDALIKNGKNFDENLVYRTNTGKVEEGYLSMKAILKNTPKVDAIFCICDMIAMGAMRAIQEKGLKIPENFGIVGFGNSLLGMNSNPSLSTVNQSGEEMGKMAILQLIKEIENKEVLDDFQNITLPTELIIRETSQR